MWLPYLPPDRIHHFIHYVKSMGSENDKTRKGVWNETERCFDGSKSLKRQKSPAKSFVWTDELKRQFAYTLKPSKCSDTDIPKSKTGNGDAGEGRSSQGATSLEMDKLKPHSKAKFFADTSIENIFSNSEYFKLMSGDTASVSFCSGERGENRWTIDTKNQSKKITTVDQMSEENGRTKKNIQNAKSSAQAEELKYIRHIIEAMIVQIKQINREFGLVKMDLKTMDNLLLQKQVSGKSKQSGKEGIQVDDNNLKLGKFSEEVEKAALELKDFIEINRTFLTENEDIPKYPDLDKIISNLHRLSEIANQPKIIQTSMGAKFEAPRELPISFYADGILLRNKEFRKFTDLKAGLFLRDIEDGFFPSELWPEFPHGVPFQVTDRRFTLFSDVFSEHVNRFPGNGRRLGTVFDGKPPTMVYLKPAKPGCVETDCSELGKKRMNNITVQDCKSQARAKNFSQNNSETGDKGKQENGDIPKLMSVKVRVGMGKEGVILVNVMSNERMSRFQDVLFAKLCERYHNEYTKNMDTKSDNSDNNYGEAVPDFEVHVYGRKPFRLSEKLNLLPSECGIVDNCVINITEI